MAKLPWMKWYPADWLNDTMILSAAARGCWITILCWMWNAPERGSWTGTYEEFSRVTGTPWESAATLITELEKVCTVTRRDSFVTLLSRRMSREESHYKKEANRQRRWRRNALRNASVTPKKLDVRSQNTSKTTPSAKAVTPFWKELIQHLNDTWTRKKRGAPYLWAGKDFAALKRISALYQPYDIMALWDLYIGSDDDFAQRQGYNITEFVRQLPRLVDGNWKAAAQQYRDKLMPPDLDGLKQVSELVSKTLVGKTL